MPRRLGATPRRALAGLAGLAGVAVVLAILLRSARVARHLDDPGVLAGLAVLGAVTVLALAGSEVVVRHRVRGQLAHVARLRPGATVVAGRPTTALTAEARRLRAGTRGLPPDAGERERVVYAVLPTRVELWVRGDDEPRWWVTRPCRVAPGATRRGLRTLETLTVSDAAARLELVPVAAYERLAAELSPDGA